MANRVNKFECDRSKARSNYRKHNVRFTEGARIFDGHVLTAPSKQNRAGAEQRYVSIGVLDTDTVVVVAWTRRTGRLRVISVRPASRDERKNYHAHIEKSLN